MSHHSENVNDQTDLLKYQTLFELSGNIIYFSNLDGTINSINQAGLELFGFQKEEEIIGKSIIDYYLNKQDRIYFEDHIKQNGSIHDFELILEINNEKKIVLESAVAIKDQSGKLVEIGSIIKNITEHINDKKVVLDMTVELSEAYEKMKELQSQLVNKEKMAGIGQLAAGVAHEINNPLGFIKSNHETLKKYIAEFFQYQKILESFINKLSKNQSPILQQAITKIIQYQTDHQISFINHDTEELLSEDQEGFERIITIIDNLKSFSRINSNREIEQKNFNQLIDTTLIVARNEYKYCAEIEKELGNLPQIEIVVGEINQVLLNIIVNAAQAINSQCEKERGVIKILTYAEKDHVICQIIDNGPGIEPDQLGQIFNPFFTTKEEGKGTGLGLNISYDIIVNKHKGELLVDSQLGKGTTFTIKIPIKYLGDENGD
ncbi:MAG: ATP-binding protein [Spirochaetes bacterium]|nr:ATP-binding protein [Spirochaetota bacterium]